MYSAYVMFIVIFQKCICIIYKSCDGSFTMLHTYILLLLLYAYIGGRRDFFSVGRPVYALRLWFMEVVFITQSVVVLLKPMGWSGGDDDDDNDDDDGSGNDVYRGVRRGAHAL